MQKSILREYEENPDETHEEDELPQTSHLLRGQDVMVTLDFQGLHERPCKGYDNPDSADSDYERWKPHDDGRHKSPDGCFLGRKFEYTRRKQESECFNGEDFEGIIDSIACPCTEADYECDVGWEMD